MKNRIILEKNKGKMEFDILFQVETEQKTKYIIYTQGEKNSEGEQIVYAGNYYIEDGKQKLDPIEDDYTLEFLDSVLIQLQNKMGTKIGE
ncbi:MAG: DUF1292 domain-containing protein [Bacilli bacterium]|nr:DUF1292 domain-containing protein [Bacilli bacterium]